MTTEETQIVPEPLTDTEFDRLAAFLARFTNDHAMNLEELDGFLAALICGPDIALPSEYLTEICGRDLLIEGVDVDLPEFKDFLSLLLRHWNVIADTLHSGDAYLPLLLLDGTGISRANDWAKGFVRGMQVHPAGWSLLVDDEDNGGSLVPIFALAHENDPDPSLRPYKEPISVEKREHLIAAAAAGVMRIYQYFEATRLLEPVPDRIGPTYRRVAPKVGRNDPCPCGSGKKFKHCCGKDKITLH
jgi:uncharacterized protein